MPLALAFLGFTFGAVLLLNVVRIASGEPLAGPPPPPRPKRQLDPDYALELYAEAQSSRDPYRVEDIADELSDGSEEGKAAQVRAALNRFYAALSATTDEARVHYWNIVGAGFLGLANRVATQRPSVLS